MLDQLDALLTSYETTLGLLDRLNLHLTKVKPGWNADAGEEIEKFLDDMARLLRTWREDAARIRELAPIRQETAEKAS